MKRLLANLRTLTILLVLFTLAGAAVGFFVEAVAIGAFFGALIGILVFFSQFNTTRAIKDSPKGTDAGYIKDPGGT